MTQEPFFEEVMCREREREAFQVLLGSSLRYHGPFPGKIHARFSKEQYVDIR